MAEVAEKSNLAKMGEVDITPIEILALIRMGNLAVESWTNSTNEAKSVIAATRQQIRMGQVDPSIEDSIQVLERNVEDALQLLALVKSATKKLDGIVD